MYHHSRLRQKRQDPIIQEKNGELMLRTVAKRQMAKSSFDGAKPPKVTNTEAEIKVKDLWLLK